MMDFCSINELFSWLPFPSTSPQLAAIFFLYDYKRIDCEYDAEKLQISKPKVKNLFFPF